MTFSRYSDSLAAEAHQFDKHFCSVLLAVHKSQRDSDEIGMRLLAVLISMYSGIIFFEECEFVVKSCHSLQFWEVENNHF